MRIFANLFLILYYADGITSLFDELASLLFPLPALTELRGLLANIVIVTAVPVYLCLGIDRRLPKKVFIPLIVYVFWCLLAGWFFPSLAGNRAFGLLAASGKVILCLLTIRHFRKTEERSPLMTKAMFDKPFFRLRNTLTFGAANLFIIPFVLLLLMLCKVDSYLGAYTSGFMRLAPDGVHMIEKVYRRDNKTIRLAAMIHVGEKEYYDELVGSVAPGRTIVLSEGVTDRKKLMRNSLDYGKLAGFLGLTSQANMHFKGRLIGKDNLDSAPPRASSEGVMKTAAPVDILRADVDVSSFRPQTIHFLNVLGRNLKENASVMKGFLSFNAWAEKNITPEINKIIMDDILYSRNREVIRQLRKALTRYDTIVIPWGAMHMPEIEGEIRKDGFKLQQVRDRVSIDFKKMLIDKLSGKSSG
jgi:hypothetical protein